MWIKEEIWFCWNIYFFKGRCMEERGNKEKTGKFQLNQNFHHLIKLNLQEISEFNPYWFKLEMKTIKNQNNF